MEVIKQMTFCFVSKNSIIFEQGTIGSYFYILKEGKVTLYIDDVEKKVLVPGDSFGDVALLHGAVRSGTIKANEDSFMWCLERKKFKQIIDYIANKNFEENKAFVKSIPMFKNMDTNFITRLSMNMLSETYDPAAFIVREGEASDCMYIVKDGVVACKRKEETIRELNKGDFFGLTSILMDLNRTMNVVAKTVCVCYSISIRTLVDLLGGDYKNALYFNFFKLAMSKSQYFSKISPDIIQGTFKAFKTYWYGKNSLVFPKGFNTKDKVSIVFEGNLVRKGAKEESDDTNRTIVSERGVILFEEAIFEESKNILSQDLVAYPDCLLLQADAKKFFELLGGSLDDVREKSNVIGSLSKVPLFKHFSLNKIKSIAEFISIEQFKTSNKIIQEGEEGSKFYIVKSGKVDIFVKKQYIRTLNELEFFGERSLVIEELRSATAVANGAVSLYVLSKEHFLKIIDDNLKEHIIQRVQLQDNTIELGDLDYIQSLGSGNFGNVYLVNCRKNNSMYALKAISKNQIDQEQLHSNLDMERQILLKIDHPFIMKLVKTLKDTKDVYFLTEYIRGKELWDVIRDIGLLNKSQTQFYGCSLFLALDYLHSRKIIYRDIKPENVMINEKVNNHLIIFIFFRDSLR